MKKIFLYLILFLLLSFLIQPTISLAANSHSIDFERDNSQYGYILDNTQTGLDLDNNLTIETWIKRESDVTEFLIAKVRSDTNNVSYQFYYTGGDLKLTWSSDGTDGSAETASVTQILNLATWYHIAVTKSGVTVKFYLNGTQIGSDYIGSTSAIFNGTAQLDIGSAQNGASANKFDGLMDDIRIWNIARTQSEISNNKNNELVGNESGLVAYWKFNNSALDETSNNNDLTLVNNPIYSTDIPFADIPPPSNIILDSSSSDYNNSSTGVFDTYLANRFYISNNFIPSFLRIKPSYLESGKTFYIELREGSSANNPEAGNILASGSKNNDSMSVNTEADINFTSSPYLPPGNYWLLFRETIDCSGCINIYKNQDNKMIFTQASKASGSWQIYGDLDTASWFRFKILGSSAIPHIGLIYPENNSIINDFYNFYATSTPIDDTGLYQIKVNYGLTTAMSDFFDYSENFNQASTTITTTQIIKNNRLNPSITYYAQAILYKNLIGYGDNGYYVIKTPIATSTQIIFNIAISSPVYGPLELNNYDLQYNSYLQTGSWASTTPSAEATTTIISTCDEKSNFFTQGLCYLFQWLFIPSGNVLNKFDSLKDEVITKAPFGYFTLVSIQLSSLASTTPVFQLELGGITDEILSPLKTGISIILWFLLLMWLYTRIKHFVL